MRTSVMRVGLLLTILCGAWMGASCSEPATDPVLGGSNLDPSAPAPKTIQSTAGAVVSQAPLATNVGVAVLEAGGNAVDAAVATAFALAVVEPSNSGLGGRTQMLIRSPDGHYSAIDGTTQVPAGYPADTVVAEGGATGYAAVGIPGTVAALTKALGEHGSWELEQVIEPAIELAQNGFPLSRAQATALAAVASDLARFDGSRQNFLKPDAAAYVEGEHFVQANLGRTLSVIAANGADGFYRGEIAHAIASDMASNGGYVTASDLESYRPRDALIVRGSYRDHELVATYLPAAGANTIQMLQTLEVFETAPVVGDASWAALVAQSAQLGFQDRLMDLARMGPAETFPLETHALEITSKDWAQDRAARVRVPDDVTLRALGEPRSGDFPEGHTTHLSVVDRQGGAVALTQSLGPTMGSRVVTAELGFAYASTMGYLSGLAASSGIRALGPGDRASSRQSPMMVSKDGELRLVLGGSGSRRIVSALVQVVGRWGDQGVSLEAAVAAPRVHVEPGQSDVVHTEVTDVARWSEADRAFLRGFGFDVRDQHDQSFGNVSAVEVDMANGLFVGVAEPRGSGSAGAPASGGGS